MEQSIDGMMKQFQENIDNAIRDLPTLSLGMLITQLEKHPRGNIINYDFPCAAPTEFRSYRGYYSQLSLGYDAHTWGEDAITVGKLLDDAKDCLGKTFTGYKGGEYTMELDTKIWVANYSNCSDTLLLCVSTQEGSNKTILHTMWADVEV